MKKWIVLPVLVVVFNMGIGGDVKASCNTMGPLKVSTQSSRYFENPCGEEVYLTGSHTWGAPFANSGAYNNTSFLNLVQNQGHNFVRLWAWESDQTDTNLGTVLAPYVYEGSGYNLDGWNGEYFSRLASVVSDASNRGLYVSVMFFQGWTVHNEAGLNLYEGHPYRSGNNNNGLNISMSGNGETHTRNSAAFERQKALVKKIIETVDQYKNVIYEVSNESHRASANWQYDIINYAKSLTNKPVGMTGFVTGYGFNGAYNNSELVNSPGDFISPTYYNSGYANNLPEATGNKVVFADTDHINVNTGDETTEWVWRTFLRGYNVIYMDPYGTNEYGTKGFMRTAMGRTRIYANKLGLGLVSANPSLCGGDDCLVQPGNQYLVYDPGRSFAVSGLSGTYNREWYNSESGAGVADSCTGSGCTSSPQGDVLLLIKSGVTNPTNTPGPINTPTNTPPPVGTTLCNQGVGVFVQCATENWPNTPGNCVFSSNSEVRYGANGTFRCVVTANSPVACTESVFGGDPIPGSDKVCSVRKALTYSDLLRSYGNSSDFDLNGNGIVNMLDFAEARMRL